MKIKITSAFKAIKKWSHRTRDRLSLGNSSIPVNFTEDTYVTAGSAAHRNSSPLQKSRLYVSNDSLYKTEIAKFLRSIDGKIDRQLDNFRENKQVNLPKIPEDLLLAHRAKNGTVSEVALGHAKLLTGFDGCAGTNEVAGWVTKTLPEHSHDKNAEIIRSLVNDEVKDKATVESIITSLVELRTSMTYLHEIKELSWFFRQNVSISGNNPNLGIDKWVNYANLCSLGILSKLKSSSTVLLPMDFLWGKLSVNSQSIEPQSHATTLILEKSASGAVSAHHFETNGFHRIAVARSEVKDARMENGKQSRAKKFDQYRFQNSNSVLNYFVPGRYSAKPKIYARMTRPIKLRSQEQNLSNDKIKEDIEFIKRLVFQETEGIRFSLAQALDHQLSHLGTGDFENQRLHAIQETDSCEIKSITVASCYLLNNEMAYQTLILSLVDRSIHELGSVIHPDKASLLKQLSHDKTHVTQRIREQMFFENA
jgi:hypothetical protein